MSGQESENSVQIYEFNSNPGIMHDSSAWILDLTLNPGLQFESWASVWMLDFSLQPGFNLNNEIQFKSQNSIDILNLEFFKIINNGLIRIAVGPLDLKLSENESE